MPPSGSDAQLSTSPRQPEKPRAKRSLKGCPECRRSKIKCDEQEPRCGQCHKRGRECHLQDSVFRRYAFAVEKSNRVRATVVRRDGRGSDPNQATSRESSNLDSPANAPYQQPEPAAPPAVGCSLPAVAVRSETEEQSRSEPVLGSCSPLPFLINDHGGAHDFQVHASLQRPATPNLVNRETTIESLKDTQEELFLLRHYSEFIAPWMDLLYRYEVFSREVLTLARKHPILRYAACAVAAKQLGQMRSPVPATLGGNKTQERIAARLVRGRLGFTWYGIKYYEKAIQTLVKSITPKEPRTAAPSTANHASPEVSLSQGDLMVRADGEDPIVRLLGTCILIQYEHLSANRDAWSGHLTGFSKLLDLIDHGQLLRRHPIFEQVFPWTKDIMEVKAGFWNFVVNDLEESFVSHRRTRIDTENLALWRNMGLLVEDDGRLYPDSLSTTPEHARDKVLSYTLIRLLCKLVDILAPVPPWETEMHNSDRSVSGTPSGTGHVNFADLVNQFDSWIRMLSPSFHPDGTFFTRREDDCITSPRSADASGLFDRELWFSNDLCSTTMMYYHMARMLLLIHGPSDLLSPVAEPSSSPSPSNSVAGPAASFDLLRTLRDLERKLRLHASEVISIVRGTPCDAVKLRAIQPLYVAGRCCTSVADRKMLVEMLTDIQDGLGIATGYRVKALLLEWGVSYQDFGMEERLTAEEQLG